MLRDGARACEIARLLLDGRVEIEGEAGFVGGPGALRFVHVAGARSGRSTLAVLSREAIEQAACVLRLPAENVAAHLYFHHRRPLTAAFASRVASRTEVSRFLGMRAGDAAHTRLSADWVQSHADEESGWTVWRPRHLRSSTLAQPRYKVYISIATADLQRLLMVVAEPLEQSGAIQFKYGSTAPTLLRADHVVAYFHSRDSALAAAARFAEVCAPFRAHGVPFTCPVDSDGRVSLGIDPPRPTGGRVSETRASWRLWVCYRLARYLKRAARAKDAGTGVNPIAFALARLALDGVHIGTWSVDEGRWRVR